MGKCFIRKSIPDYPWPLSLYWHKPPTRLYKVKTPYVPPVSVDTTAIEEEYLTRYFRPIHEERVEEPIFEGLSWKERLP